MPGGQWGAAGVLSGSPATCQLLPLNAGLVWILEVGTPGLSVWQLTEPASAPTADSEFSRKEQPVQAEKRGQDCLLLSGHSPALHTRDGLGSLGMSSCRGFSRIEGPGRQVGAGKLQILWGKVPEQIGDKEEVA